MLTTNSTLHGVDEEFHSLVDSAIEELVEASGYVQMSPAVRRQMFNFISYIRGPLSDKRDDDGDGALRDFCWTYQLCTEWALFRTGSGVPADQYPLVSRTIDIDFFQEIYCRSPHGITSLPDTNIINAYGGYDIAYDRLAIIDSMDDPWRYATPHRPGEKLRQSTADQPFKLVVRGGHGPDYFGWGPEELIPVDDVVSEEVGFLWEWMKEWNAIKHSD